MHITGDPVLDETIKEIATKTVFDIETAKHFYLKTADKEFCVELSKLFQMGYNLNILDYVADGHVNEKSNKAWEEFKKLYMKR